MNSDPPVPMADAIDGDSTTVDENSFFVKFETTKGDFYIRVSPSWAPLGAERFRELVEAGFYDDQRFFRVVPGFVVQWGIHGDPTVAAKWRDQTIADDPVKVSNQPGFITFATSGPDSRTTQVFINFGDNSQLDGMGFAPFGEIVAGFETVESLNGEYREAPSQAQGRIQVEGNAFLDEKFPNLDRIISAKIVDKVGRMPNSPGMR